MRVGENGARPREAADAGRSRRFGEALREARKAGRPAAHEEAQALALPAARASTARRSADRSDGELRGRRDDFREEARAAEPQQRETAPVRPSEVSAPELRALVRTLPLAIQTFGVEDGAPLTLSFGRSLDVELRAVPGGVELVLRPEPRLARATEAELRAVVTALGAKGVQVARATIRARGAQGGTGGPRVDLPGGLR
jgi:hypothetical protein